MTLPGPVLIIGIPVVVSLALQFLRRWTTISAALGAVVTIAIGSLVAFLPLDAAWRLGGIRIEMGTPLYVLGRQLVVRPADQLALTFLFFTTAGLFIVAWRLLPHSNFFPLGLMAVALLAGALLVEQVVYAALLVEMAAVLTVFPLHESGGSASGGLRYMIYATLALPGLMITQLLLDLFAIFPNDVGLLTVSAVLLNVSFAILFGAVPFQSWLSTVATDGSPPVVTFIFTVSLSTMWFMLLDYLQTYAWLGRQAPLGMLFSAIGLLMMGIGGLLAASQRRLGRLVGYATLVDNGAMLLALGTERVEGIALAILILFARPLALGLMTLGLQGLRTIGNGDDSREAMLGAAWRAPWRAVAFLVGGIALAGFPISLGFAARWGLYRLVATENLFLSLMALTGSAGVMLGLVGAMRTLLTPLSDDKPKDVFVEDRVVIALIVVLLVTTLTFGFSPNAPSRIASSVAAWYTFFQ